MERRNFLGLFGAGTAITAIGGTAAASIEDKQEETNESPVQETEEVTRVDRYENQEFNTYGFDIETPPNDQGIFTVIGKMPRDIGIGTIVTFGGDRNKLTAKMISSDEYRISELRRYYFEVINGLNKDE